MGGTGGERMDWNNRQRAPRTRPYLSHWHISACVRLPSVHPATRTAHGQGPHSTRSGPARHTVRARTAHGQGPHSTRSGPARHRAQTQAAARTGGHHGQGDVHCCRSHYEISGFFADELPARVRTDGVSVPAGSVSMPTAAGGTDLNTARPVAVTGQGARASMLCGEWVSTLVRNRPLPGDSILGCVHADYFLAGFSCVQESTFAFVQECTFSCVQESTFSFVHESTQHTCSPRSASGSRRPMGLAAGLPGVAACGHGGVRVSACGGVRLSGPWRTAAGLHAGTTGLNGTSCISAKTAGLLATASILTDAAGTHAADGAPCSHARGGMLLRGCASGCARPRVYTRRAARGSLPPPPTPMATAYINGPV